MLWNLKISENKKIMFNLMYNKNKSIEKKLKSNNLEKKLESKLIGVTYNRYTTIIIKITKISINICKKFIHVVIYKITVFTCISKDKNTFSN